MYRIPPFLLIIALTIIGCGQSSQNGNPGETRTYEDIKIAGEMKRVMWEGKLGSSIDLDSISEKEGLFGLGPEIFLRGEILINDGKSFVSRVTSDSTMSVIETYDVSAPFMVYGNVREWTNHTLPEDVTTISELEHYLDSVTSDFKRPFVFKLSGEISTALIHVQNLPEGTEVSSPKEAHQGQVNYPLTDEQVEIVGFFSTEHQGIFTHHDSFLHMHLMTADREKMGHLDEIEMKKMKVYLPVN